MGMGPDTIVIYIMADDVADGPLPSQQLLDEVFAYIGAQRNVTAHVYVIAPTPVPFIPQIRVTPDNSKVRVSVEQALRELILRAGRPAGTLSISQIRTAIGTAAGVTDYELEYPIANVPNAYGELPAWGGAQWLV